MNRPGILMTNLLVYMFYSAICLWAIPDKAFGGMVMAMVIAVHGITLMAYGAAADRGSDARKRYFLMSIFVLLIGPSMCISTVFR